MRFSDLQDKLRGFPIFSLEEIRLLDPSFHRQRLTEWQARGVIRKVVRRYYMLSSTPLTETSLFAAANRIYAPSYISLESAFAEYRLIPESVYSVTSVTTRKTASFDTPLTRFSYRTVQRRLFMGYRVLRPEGYPVLMASPEKAVFDYLYLKTDVRSKEDIAALRFDRTAAGELIDWKALESFAAMCPVEALRRRLGWFREYLDHA